MNTHTRKEPSLFGIEPEVANPVLKKTLMFSKGVLAHSLKLDGIDKIYRESRLIDDNLPFADKVLRTMNVRYDITEADKAHIPGSGPVLVVANHPFGGVEGIIMLALLQAIRPDVKVMANYLLGRIPEMRDSFVFVDPFGNQKSARANIRPLKTALSWLKGGGLLGTFPSGEVSSIDLRSGTVRDPAWNPSVAAMVRHTQATVVPMFFAGHNGPLFQLAGLVHPRFRTLMLPGQVINKRNSTVRIHVGAPIPWRELQSHADDPSIIGYLRLRTYILAEREARPPKRRLTISRRSAIAEPEAIAAPESVEDCCLEVAALPAELKMLSSGDFDVFLARAEQIPVILRELGRLREITFRNVGEGTGKARDLDVFDNYYLHLFIWNRKTSEIVGAYRLGLSDVIFEQFGCKGLYTRSLFRFDSRLLACLQPALELGRSFVRPEYQKAYSSLLLLWKGIASFIARNPRYKTLFGPVSITNEYRDASRNLMLRSLRLSNFAPELARFVKPRKRPKRCRRAEWTHSDFTDYLDDIEQVSSMIQDIEHDQKGIPILLRQYLRLGGRILAFNLDPSFSSVVDGLIAIDLRNTDPRTLRRYMGTENANIFLKYQAELLSERPVTP